MSMRVLLRQHLIERPGLIAIIPAERWYGSGSVVQNAPRPFAEMRWGTNLKGMANVTRRRVDIYVHDVDGDYDRIDDVLGILRAHLDGLEHVDFEGSELIRSEWTGDSVDLFDDGYKTIYRSTSYDIVGKD